MRLTSIADLPTSDSPTPSLQVEQLTLTQLILAHPECPLQIPALPDSARTLLRLPEKNRRNPRFLAFLAQKDPVYLTRLLCLSARSEFNDAGCYPVTADDAITVLGTAKSLSAMLEIASVPQPQFASTEFGAPFYTAQQLVLSRCLAHSLTAQRVASYLELTNMQASQLQICCLLDSLGLFVGLYGNEELSIRLQQELMRTTEATAVTHILSEYEHLQDYALLAQHLARQWNVDITILNILKATQNPLQTPVLMVERMVDAKRRRQSQQQVLQESLKSYTCGNTRMRLGEIDLAVLPW